ncbi:MAG: hypothetical protein QOD56_2985 [Gammaproteobacteria bacterium]|jgi:hypothetical protein|nr:hypothetical protein [Gammaproteobacteria bacterium]
MQDANVKRWAREAHVSAKMLESVRELNHRFLDLIAAQPNDWNSSRLGGVPSEVLGQVTPLSAAQKKAAANCPYVLFDLRFHDDSHWQTRFRTGGRWSVADPASVDDATLEFVRLALFFAWHVALASELAARLLLGMNDATVAAFRTATIDCLPSVGLAEAANLTARWSHCPSYWRALTGAAAHPNPAGLRRVQLYGLQLTAAARLG